jgi:hypothetical protein
VIPTAAPLQQSKSTRLVELDILRGFLLLWMTLTHLPTKASVISNQTFGFVSGAEGFIFLAGFMIGQLEHRIEAKGGFVATLRDVEKRISRVYIYHVVLLLITFTVVAWVAVHYHRVALLNLLSFYLAHPKRATVAAAILKYRPSLLDILPMYVLFLALTPMARWVARRWSWDPVVYTSFAIWAVAQFGIRHWVHTHFDLFHLGVPEDSTGAFDTFAWQLLWLVGLALGSIYSDQISGPETQEPAQGRKATQSKGIPAGLTKLAMVVALLFLVLRYSPVDHWMDQDVYGWLIDKWHLGPARVINFAAITLVLVRFGQNIAALPIFQPLALLGRASLEVFSVHVLCCLGGHMLSPEADPNLPGWQQILLLACTMAALFGTAEWHRRRQLREKKK